MALLAGLALHPLEGEDGAGDEGELWNLVRGIYTYGQPMVVADWKVTDECQDRIGDRLFRYVYFNDIIPHLPPLFVGGYDHVGYEYKFLPRRGDWKLRGGRRSFFNWWKPRATQLGSLILAAPWAGLDAVAVNIAWLPRFMKTSWSIDDHSPVRYIESWDFPRN
jgi:hypothetical protein